MVSKKRLHYGGFDGFRAPVVPKAPRSIRRTSHKKSSAGGEICAFELLAAVAGKLLQESEGSASSTGPEGKEQISIPKDGVKQEPLEDLLKPVRFDDLDQGCFAESEFVPKPSNLELKLESPLKDSLHSDNDSGLEHASIITTSDFIKEINTNLKLEASDRKNGVIGSLTKSEGGSPSHGDLCDVNMDTNRAEAVEKQTEDLQDTKKTSVLNKSFSSVHVPFYSDPVPSACFRRHRGSNVKIGIRDDDENSFSCNHHSTKLRTFRSQSRSGYRRIRKMLNAKYWKTAPKLKDYELSNTTNGGTKPLNHNRKNIYKAEAASKRRKLFHHEYVQEPSSESISNFERSVSGDKRHPSKREKAVTSSFQSKDGHVKFSIKSFKVPELYLEMPETSTVGSLKRTVMEAVTAILGGELHLGVFLQGKKVKDDNRTLQQTGISLNGDTLGFMLEPSLPQSLVQEKPPVSPQSEINEPLLKCPEVPFTDMSLADPPPEKNESQPASTEEIVEADQKAIVPITAVNPEEALSIVPLNKKSELSQRRTRRPFSVSEVEALVEAVETLGTGRWRDVKIRAFDDANHRTYVDLKDKWKTLVHTASISPQQRRGEPVPQDLLDRVLAAHAFWTQHQSKQQHVKHQSEALGTPVKVCLELEG